MSDGRFGQNKKKKKKNVPMKWGEGNAFVLIVPSKCFPGEVNLQLIS